MPVRTKPPSYRLHKPTGQAVVRLNGRDFYLGLHGTQTSRDEYDRLVGEWMANGRAMPHRGGGGMTVAELCSAFGDAAKLPPSHEADWAIVVRLLVRLYGQQPADTFGPLALMAVRQVWADAGLKRTTIAARVNKIRRVFRWGVSREHVAPSVIQALEAVEGLKEGETNAAEAEPVVGVDDTQIEAVLPRLPTMLAAMVRLERLTGMRTKEVCTMRTCDIDTRGPVWVYRPADHKGRKRGKVREIAIGAKAIEVLRPYLLPDLQAYVFTPERSETMRLAEKRAKRTTPLNQGNSAGRRWPPRPRRKFAPRYTTTAVRNAIHRAADTLHQLPLRLAKERGETDTAWKKRLGPALWSEVQEWRRSHRWSPHQLRHAFGEQVREQFGPDHVQAALGHAHLRTGEIYGKLSRGKSVEVATAIG